MSRRPPRGPMWKNRIVGHGHESPDQLLGNPFNWRIHPEAQQDELEKLLETVGWVGEVMVNRRTGHMVDGHVRVLLALRREEETVPVSYIDVSEAEEKLILATFDAIAAMAGRDEEKLVTLAEDIATELEDFADSGIDLEVIHASGTRKKTRGLKHDVRQCKCCEKKCKPGCGCFRDEK